jgi:hypothetical protein
MPSQDGQGRKLLHIVSIVANLPITEVERHYRKMGIFRQNAKVVDSLLSSTLRIAGMRRNERARERAPQCRRPFSNEDAA